MDNIYYVTEFIIFSIWAYMYCNKFIIWDFLDRLLCKINICCYKIVTVER